MSSSATDEQVCGCKVGRLIQMYDLSGMNRQLVEWWSSDDNGRSLREMAEHLNHELLREEMNRQGYSPLQGEVQNTYRLLADDDVSQGMQTQTRKQLERQGFDADQLLDDFVSHQAVYRHLKTCLDEEYTQTRLNDEERRTKSKERIFALENRTEKVTEDALAQLRKQDALALEEFAVLVDVSVACLSCGRQHAVEDLLNDGGCRCFLSEDV